jgi:hypothetical protein
MFRRSCTVSKYKRLKISAVTALTNRKNVRGRDANRHDFPGRLVKESPESTSGHFILKLPMQYADKPSNDKNSHYHYERHGVTGHAGFRGCFERGFLPIFGKIIAPWVGTS